MAKENRGGRRGGSSAKGELVLPSGSKIEFEGTLHYDGDDKALTGNARATVTSWEAKRVKNKIEYGYAVTADGKPVGAEVKGGKGSVQVPYSFTQEVDGTTTHIHPRSDGVLGGTFSGADIRVFAKGKNKTFRAAAKEGTYSISKTAKFDRAGFEQYAKECEANFKKKYKADSNKAIQDYRNSKITYNEYLKADAKVFNTALVQLHNDYRKGQKKYGYTYTLEKN